MTNLSSVSKNDAEESGSQPPVAELINGIFSDAQTLIRQQVHMLAIEFREDMQRTRDTVQYLGVGIALITTGGVSLIFSVVYFLTWLFPGLPVAAAWAIVGSLSLGVGILFVWLGQRLLDRFNPLPDKTFNALQENVSWITKTLK